MPRRFVPCSCLPVSLFSHTLSLSVSLSLSLSLHFTPPHRLPSRGTGGKGGSARLRAHLFLLLVVVSLSFLWCASGSAAAHGA